MGRGNKNKTKKKKKTYTKAQQLAQQRIANQNVTGTTGTTGTTGIGPVKSGDTYAKSLQTTSSQIAKDNKKYGNTVPSGSFGISQAGKDQAAINRGIAAAQKTGIPSGKNLKSGSFGISQAGKKQAAINRASVKQSSGAKFKESPKQVAMLGGDNLGSAVGIGSVIGAGLAIPSMIKNAVESGNELRQNIERRLNPEGEGDQSSIFRKPATDTQVAIAGNLGGLGISPVGQTPNYFKIKSPESFGAPSQSEVDAAAGIGGLNIGGSTPNNPNNPTGRAIFTGKNPDTSDRPASSFNFGPTIDRFGRGDEYAKNINEFGMRFGATPEARAKAYEQSLDPNSFKGLSDGMTFGVGPVASGDAYVRGLNTDNKNVENRLRQLRNLGSTLTGGLIPPVRKLADKEIADRRVKNAAFRQANLVGRGGGSGGARLPVAPLTPEEILLPEETAAQTAPIQQVTRQTGVDPNRLLQIQQQAYAQAYNPMLIGGFNPQFRFGAATPTIDYSTYFNY